MKVIVALDRCANRLTFHGIWFIDYKNKNENSCKKNSIPFYSLRTKVQGCKHFTNFEVLNHMVHEYCKHAKGFEIEGKEVTDKQYAKMCEDAIDFLKKNKNKVYCKNKEKHKLVYLKYDKGTFSLIRGKCDIKL